MINKVIENLNKNGYETYLVEKKEEVVPLLDSLIEKGSVISFGGSVTLDECNVYSFIKNGEYTLLDRYKTDISPEEKNEIFRKSFFANYYLTSTNALTEDGYLYNVDGTGNRVAAMIYGPDNVIVVCGTNKIVKDIKEAEIRVKQIAGPKNCSRLKLDTYCKKTGQCISCENGFVGCGSDSRICCDYVIMGKQRIKNRIKIILVNEELGY